MAQEFLKVDNHSDFLAKLMVRLENTATSETSQKSLNQPKQTSHLKIISSALIMKLTNLHKRLLIQEHQSQFLAKEVSNAKRKCLKTFSLTCSLTAIIMLCSMFGLKKVARSKITPRNIWQ